MDLSKTGDSCYRATMQSSLVGLAAVQTGRLADGIDRLFSCKLPKTRQFSPNRRRLASDNRLSPSQYTYHALKLPLKAQSVPGAPIRLLTYAMAVCTKENGQRHGQSPRGMSRSTGHSTHARPRMQHCSAVRFAYAYPTYRGE